jgi:hypothetical protein
VARKPVALVIGVLLALLGLCACSGAGPVTLASAAGVGTGTASGVASNPTLSAAVSVTDGAVRAAETTRATPAPLRAMPPAATSSTTATIRVPAAIAALLPQNATLLAAQQAQLRDDGSTQWVVVYRVPGPNGATALYPPPSTHLAILQHAPAGWSIAKSVDQGFALAAHMQVLPIDGRMAVALQYGTGAHAAGLLIVRYDGVLDYAVVFDATSDAGMAVKDLNEDGMYEVVRTWSPYCGSFAASPDLTIVYAWRNGRFAVATSAFPAVIAKDTATFQAALTRSGADWKPDGLACLHASLRFLASESGNTTEATAQMQEAKQADSAYDVSRITKLAAGQPLVPSGT